MKILHINSYDNGGAAKACLRLHTGLIDAGVDSKVLLRQKSDNSIKNTFEFDKVIKIQAKIINKVIRISKELKLVSLNTIEEKEGIALLKQRKGLEMFSFPISDSDIMESIHYKEADIIHLHWVANFLDWKSFFQKNKKPIIWTLHDQNPFLGIEHYAERYLGIDNNGFPILRKYTQAEINSSKKWASFKEKTLKEVKNITIVSPSLWLKNESEQSNLFGKYKNYHIPNGFPTDIFKPLNKFFCREILDLPQNKKVILFAADSIENNRKGFVYLKKALEQLPQENQESIYLCAIGAKTGIQENNNLVELGKIQDERLMAMAYAAADVFIVPSLEDNFPNTMIEALLCGTPVIGFPSGGIIDAIKSNVNGYICPEISVEALKNTIETFLNNIDSFDNTSIALLAKEKYTLKKQANAYIDLYKTIMS